MIYLGYGDRQRWTDMPLKVGRHGPKSAFQAAARVFFSLFHNNQEGQEPKLDNNEI